MDQFTVRIEVKKVGKGCKLKSVTGPFPPAGLPPDAQPKAGDQVVWVVNGDQGQASILIREFKHKTNSAAKCPFDRPGYGIMPGQGDVIGQVVPKPVKGKYRYKVRAVTPAQLGWACTGLHFSNETMADGGAVIPSPSVLMLADGDSEMNPDIQIGGTG